MAKLVRPKTPPRMAPSAGTQQHGTQGDRNDDEGDLQRKDADVPQRCVVEQQDQRRKQRKAAQTDGFLIQIHVIRSPYCRSV